MRGLRLDAGGSQVTEAVSEAHDLSPRFPHGVKEGYKRTFSGPSPHGRRHLFCMGDSAQCQRALPKGTYRFIAIRLLRSQRPSNFCYCDMGLGSWRWASQLPLGEAYAPQARGVHGLHHHVEYPAVADVMIETEKSTMPYEPASHAAHGVWRPFRGLLLGHPRMPFPMQFVPAVPGLCAALVTIPARRTRMAQGGRAAGRVDVWRALAIWPRVRCGVMALAPPGCCSSTE